MKFFRNFAYFLSLALVFSTFTGCVDQDFDAPDLSDLEEVQFNTTIAELLARHTTGEDPVLIEDDVIIGGIVVADDFSGNFFKRIIIQDETGGIEVRLNLVGLSDIYPEGMEVFVKCQGLYLGDFAGLPQLNGAYDAASGETFAIEEILVPDFVIASNNIKPRTPEVVTISQLDDPNFFSARLNTLIQLEDVEFSAASAGATYADAVNLFSVNLFVEDCNSNSIILRSSGFSDFAAETTPTGNGTITAVLSVFRDDKQLIIRNTDDVQLAGPRCDGSTGTGGDEEQIDIISLRELFATGGTEGPTGKKIKGVVVSDAAAENIQFLNLVVQDATGGIVVRFTDAPNLPLGTEIEVVVSGQELSEFNGLLQVNNVPLTNVTDLGAGTLPEPREATVSEILDNGEEWESTLVKVSGVTITGGATFSGPRTVTDATGSISMFTRNVASFANDAIPSGSVDLVALVGSFDGPQLNMRNGNDVSGGTTGGGDPEQMDIADLRSVFTGVETSAPPLKKIRGIVISDTNNGNLTGRNLVLQDGTAGIVVRFEDEHSFALGEELEVVVSGEELSEFNGLLQVNNVPNMSAVSFGNGTMPEPREATVSEILANLEEWESTLVKILDASIAGDAGTYNGLTTITDASGMIGMYTRPDASFSGDALPSGSVTLTAIVSQFNDPQVIIRNLNDIQ